MLQKRCAGAVVFHRNEILLLHNQKHEWVLPKGDLKPEESSRQQAVESLLRLTGLRASVEADLHHTEYEGYSVSRRRPVHVRVHWYLMLDHEADVNLQCGTGEYDRGGFYPLEEALDKLTYTQEKMTLVQAYQVWKGLTHEPV